MKKTAIGVLSILLLVAGTALAQADLTGRLQGVVEDPAEAVIPGASVTATHLATGSVYRATTNEAGRFVIPGARLGLYNIAVEFQGFRRAVVQNVLVEVGTTASISVTLQVGAVAEEVIVTADAAQEILNTVDAEISTVVDERRVLELPLNGRNAVELTLLQAGVYYETTATGEGNKLHVHGQRHSALSITLDGLDVQDNFNRASSIMINQPLIALSAENVQEFKVATGNTSAEYSRGGSHVSAVTRSGSNEWHGSLFWFHRNDAFSANDFFNNTVGQETPKLVRNQFGGRVSGPIIKDKTFFFFGYQQTRLVRGIPVNRTVWSPEARQGIWGYLDGLRTTPENVAANPGLIRQMDLLDCSGTTDSNPNDCFDDRFQVTDPIVSSGRLTLDPLIGGELMAAMPLPNNTLVGDGLNLMGYRFNSKSYTFEHLPAFRLDHVFSPKHSFYATWNYTDRNIVGDYINENEIIWPALGALGNRTTLSNAFGLGLTSTFTPTIVNEFRAGVTMGENAFPRNQPFNTPFTLDIDDITDPYGVGDGIGSWRDNETWHTRNTVSWVKGNHQFKFGGEWRHRFVDNRNFLGNEAWGEIDFDDADFDPGWTSAQLEQYSRMPDGSVPPTTPDIVSADATNAEELNNALIGAMGEVEVRYQVIDLTSGFQPLGAGEVRHWENNEFDLFFNDTWQIHPRLTLNMGLRWEYAGVPGETRGLMLLPLGGEDAVFGVSGAAGWFNPGVFEGTPCPFLNTLPVAPTVANVLAMIDECAIRNDLAGGDTGVKLWNEDYNNFGPVLSLAWDPWGDGKSAIRAGYRISYYQDHFAMVEDLLDDNEGLRALPICNPSDAANPCQNVDPNDDLAALLRNVTGPPVPPMPTFSLPTVPPFTFLNATDMDFRTYIKDLETPYYQEWNLSVSREFWGNTAFEVRYVGNRGLKLRRTEDFNNINVNAYDPVTGMTFLEAFEIAQSNLACNRSAGVGDDYSSTPQGVAAGCITPNPLMDDLIAMDSADLDSRGDLIDALDFNESGDFAWHLTIDEATRPSVGQADMRGGAFWGQVLNGRFPLNFFTANPFIASSRRMTNDGFSTYHALEIEARRRFSQGLMFQANYTFGKALSDYDGDQNVLEQDTHPGSSVNGRYTTVQFMPRHQFNANWIYELPFGPGKAFALESAAARKLLGGWQFGGIVRFRSGRPFSILSGTGTFIRNAISDDNRVDLLQPMSSSDLRSLSGRQDIGGGIFWLDPCMSSQIGGACTNPNAIAGLFQLPAPGRLGTLPATTFYGPGRFLLDLNLAKQTQITETVKLEFRWEVFNATNTPNFGLPATNIFSLSFGQVTNTVTEARVMQFALKINF